MFFIVLRVDSMEMILAVGLDIVLAAGLEIILAVGLENILAVVLSIFSCLHGGREHIWRLF